MSKEYDCRCNCCGAQWFYNDQDIRDIQNRIQQAKGKMLVGAVSAFSGSKVNPMYQGQAAERVLSSTSDLTRCGKCGSSDVDIACSEVYNYFLDDPSSPLAESLTPLPSTNGGTIQGTKSKTVAGLLGIFLGCLGAHKFYLGYTKEGAIMLLISLIGGILTLGSAALIVALVGLIEGIIYLTKRPDAFDSIYVQSHKGWF